MTKLTSPRGYHKYFEGSTKITRQFHRILTGSHIVWEEFIIERSQEEGTDVFEIFRVREGVYLIGTVVDGTKYSVETRSLVPRIVSARS